MNLEKFKTTDIIAKPMTGTKVCISIINNVDKTSYSHILRAEIVIPII